MIIKKYVDIILSLAYSFQIIIYKMCSKVRHNRIADFFPDCFQDRERPDPALGLDPKVVEAYEKCESVPYSDS